ncbi:hypothetical protein BED47_07190 [Gottfriedia luciferensis]|uniref:SbsC C-terminal domain-containing protein n=1 Tax=Gottfriedia luciferensis TaxID=178774 RepID=A0ABX2ZSJ8_9BACI|nr:hypothetical protein [Gottfriedia luciferensis]ODG91434.1 hypothetical protein BED47_07190 [Gottfriedia luciferensis]
MNKIKKIATIATATTLSAGILLGMLPTETQAATNTKVVQAQNDLKKQVSSYIKVLNNLKSEIYYTDQEVYDYYKELQTDVTLFNKYGYTGKDALVTKTTSFKTRIDKARKDNAAVDMKKITAQFNTYIKKVDSKNAKTYFTTQKNKLMAIRNYQNHTYDTIESYVYDIEDQILTENEIYIRKQLPVEYKNYETEKTLVNQRFFGMTSKEQEIISYAYDVLDMDYTTHRQIEKDLDSMFDQYFKDGFDEIYDVEDNESLDYALQKRDVAKAKVALVNYTAVYKKFNNTYNQFEAAADVYKTNLTVKFANKVKKAPSTQQ